MSQSSIAEKSLRKKDEITYIEFIDEIILFASIFYYR